MMRSHRYWVAALGLLAMFGSARADTFYVVVFSGESKPPRPKFSHSWATFVRIPGGCHCGPCAPNAGPIETVTISWLPCKVALTPNVPFSEPGQTFDLHPTMDICLSECEEISAFGPYEIKEELWCRAVKQKAKLESGDVRYKTIDTTFNPRRVSNCIHALTSFHREYPRLRVGRTNYGDVASYFVTNSYSTWIYCTHRVDCWVADLLDLGKYPIRWRTLDQGRPTLRD